MTRNKQEHILLWVAVIKKGYRLVFNSNGTVSVYKVTGTSYVWGLTPTISNGIGLSHHNITVSLGTYTIPAGCALIYSQAKTWIEGTVSRKITIVAADTGSYNPDIVLNGNIGYTATDGSVGLTVLAERSVVIPVGSPDSMSIRGVLLRKEDTLDAVSTTVPILPMTDALLLRQMEQ